MCNIIVVSPAFAVEMNNLYVADVFVTSQDEKQLKASASAGLLQVLVRVSGDDQLAQNAVIRNALVAPEAYYYQYSYQATEREFQMGDKIVSTKILRLHFQPDAIANLLRAADLPVWGTNRPDVLVWLALDDAAERRLVADTESSELIELLNIHAAQRGIPLLYPLLDLEDLTQISVADVWGSFKTPIDTASERYSPDSILTVRLQKLSAGRWAANWSYRIESRWYNGNHTAFSANDVALTMIDDLADALAGQYAFAANKTEVELLVEDIRNVGDYAGVTQYLATLAPVIESQVVEIRGTEVRFRLIMQGSGQRLAGLIRLDEKMILRLYTSRMNKLKYQWMN